MDFLRSNELLKHQLQSHAGSNELQCQFCDANLARLSSLQNHFQKVHLTSGQFTIVSCQQHSESSGSLLTHLKLSHFKLKCPAVDCNYTAKSFADGRTHYNMAHCLLSAFYTCNQCDTLEQFPNREALNAHHLATGHSAFRLEPTFQGTNPYDNSEKFFTIHYVARANEDAPYEDEDLFWTQEVPVAEFDRIKDDLTTKYNQLKDSLAFPVEFPCTGHHLCTDPSMKSRSIIFHEAINPKCFPWKATEELEAAITTALCQLPAPISFKGTSNYVYLYIDPIGLDSFKSKIIGADFSHHIPAEILFHFCSAILYVGRGALHRSDAHLLDTARYLTYRDEEEDIRPLVKHIISLWSTKRGPFIVKVATDSKWYDSFHFEASLIRTLGVGNLCNKTKGNLPSLARFLPEVLTNSGTVSLLGTHLLRKALLQLQFNLRENSLTSGEQGPESVGNHYPMCNLGLDRIALLDTNNNRLITEETEAEAERIRTNEPYKCPRLACPFTSINFEHFLLHLDWDCQSRMNIADSATLRPPLVGEMCNGLLVTKDNVDLFRLKTAYYECLHKGCGTLFPVNSPVQFLNLHITPVHKIEDCRPFCSKRLSEVDEPTHEEALHYCYPVPRGRKAYMLQCSVRLIARKCTIGQCAYYCCAANTSKTRMTTQMATHLALFHPEEKYTNVNEHFEDIDKDHPEAEIFQNWVRKLECIHCRRLISDIGLAKGHRCAQKSATTPENVLAWQKSFRYVILSPEEYTAKNQGSKEELWECFLCGYACSKGWAIRDHVVPIHFGIPPKEQTPELREKVLAYAKLHQPDEPSPDYHITCRYKYANGEECSKQFARAHTAIGHFLYEHLGVGGKYGSNIKFPKATQKQVNKARALLENVDNDELFWSFWAELPKLVSA